MSSEKTAMTIQEQWKTDVLVVGAGASGIPAAIAAAREGVNVLLVEEDAMIGGATTDYYVDMFCGGPRVGIIRETEAMLKANDCLKTKSFFLPSDFVRVFMHLLRREKRLTTITGARATSVIMRRGAVAGILLSRYGRKDMRIESRVTLDCTGSGAIALLAGCRSMYGREARRDFNEPHAPSRRDGQVQQCTWMYISQQMDAKKPLNMMTLDHVRLGVLVPGLGWFHNDPEKAMQIKPRIYLHWGCAVKCRDTRDPMALADARREALNVMARDHALLRQHGFAIYLAPRIGIREQSRILGEQVVTENDLRSGILPDDTIALGTYGFDIWGEKKALNGLSKAERHVPGYGIPYRALIPRDVDGLVVAGKAISGTHIAMSAYRVMPIVGSVGQAAGIAAALCIKQKRRPRHIAADEIRNILESQRHQVKLRFD